MFPGPGQSNSDEFKKARAIVDKYAKFRTFTIEGLPQRTSDPRRRGRQGNPGSNGSGFLIWHRLHAFTDHHRYFPSTMNCRLSSCQGLGTRSLL